MLSILNRKSDDHKHITCEDSVFVRTEESIIYGGVFDGCSSGIKSAWASQTFAYLLSNHVDLTEDETLRKVWSKLYSMKLMLGLSEMNLLSTCLLFKYNTESKVLEVRPFGDGFYFVNSVEYEVDQKNEPDYFGYWVEENLYEKFLDFLNRYPVRVYENVNTFIICSDGIKQIRPSQFTDDNTNPLSLLLHPPPSPNYLELKYNILKNKKFTLSDDLSIISYANEY